MDKTQLYYELYAYISEWIEHINPCEIRINSKGKLTCKGIESKEEQNRDTLCCGPCELDPEDNNSVFKWPYGACNHLSPQGCTVKSLSCKLWFCKSAWKNIIKNREPEDIANFMLALQYTQQKIRNENLTVKSRYSDIENLLLTNT